MEAVLLDMRLIKVGTKWSEHEKWWRMAVEVNE